MWNKREKSMFWGRSKNFYSTGSEHSSRENTRLFTPSDGPDRQFMDDTSRKRKAVDSDFVNNVYDDVSPRFWANLSGNPGHVLPRESSSQHNIVTIDSQRKTAEMFSDHNLQTAKPTSALSQCGNYQFYNMNNSLLNLQRRDENFQDAVVDSSRYKEPSFLIRTPVGGIPKLPDSRNLEHDICSPSQASKLQSYYKQSCDSVEKTHAALRSNNGINSGLGNINLSSTQYHSHTLSSQDLTFLGPSQSRMANEEFNRGGGTYAQDFSKSRLAEMKKSGQNMWSAEDNGISICTTNSGQTSVSDGKETNGSYRYSNTEIRSSNYHCHDILGTHLNVRDRDMLQSPVLAESSGREEACLDNEIPKYMTLVSTDLGTKPLEKDDGSNIESNCHSLGEGTSPKNDITLVIRPVELGDGPPSLNLDEQSKSVAAKISPVFVEKLWDGSLQLNTSTTVSTVALFKSGEKAQDINWSEHIEIKGKVRLQAFEKFIQELPRSRNRALMVISLCWKIGSSKAGFVGMKEVAKGYRESERVGFAHICPGFDLYVCPRSDTIITILAKCGFFKGMAAVEEDQDSLIGCVVFRRSPPSSNPIPKKSERKKVTIPEQAVNSPEPTILETNSPLPKIHDSESKQPIPCTTEPDGVPSQFMSNTGSADLDNARHRTTESKVIHSSNDLHDASSKHINSAPETAPTPYSSLIPVQLPTAQQPGSTSLQETMVHSQIATMQAAEPRNPDLGSEPTQSVLPGPPPKFPEIQQRNAQSSKDLLSLSDFHTGSVPELNPSIPSNSLLKTAQPSATQWSNSNSRQDPTDVSKAGIPFMHTAELKKPEMGFELTRPTFPGSPQLPPEVLERIINSCRDANQDAMNGMSKPEVGIMNIAELKKAAMSFESAGPMLPRAPQSLPQTQQNSADLDEDDDLPEFDFDSACGVLEVSVSKFPWPARQSHFPEAPQFNKQLPIEVVKNADGPMLPVVPMSKPTEVMQRSQASSLPEKPFNPYQGITLPTKFGELNSENKPEYQASQLLSRQSTAKVDKGPASSRSSISFHRWDDDDDDDMPEWCPPDLEHLEQPQPSKTTRTPPQILKLTSENTEPRHPFPARSSTSFHQPQSQGILHGYQPGLLGSRPAGCSPAESVQTRPVGRFAQSEMRRPMVPGPNHPLRPPIRKLDIKPPADANRSWRRP